MFGGGRRTTERNNRPDITERKKETYKKNEDLTFKVYPKRLHVWSSETARKVSAKVHRWVSVADPASRRWRPSTFKHTLHSDYVQAALDFQARFIFQVRTYTIFALCKHVKLYVITISM